MNDASLPPIKGLTSMIKSNRDSSVDLGVITRQCLGAGFVRTEDFEKRAEQVMSGVL